MAEKKDRIRELIKILNEAAEAYYKEDIEKMSNYEYDRLYDELAELEKETGIIFPDSPTRNVGYEAAKELIKERHETPMLSLDKTKEPAALKDFLGTQKGILSWKLDGLTMVLTYEDGSLFKAVTRGNGEIGELVTANARCFVNIPADIPYKGHLVIRGEAVIRYSDFGLINETIEDVDAKYKNPRNLCSGSVRQLDPSVTAKRKVNFYAFSLENAEGVDFSNSNINKLRWLNEQGFEVVPFKETTALDIEDKVAEYSAEIENFDIPSDGLVLLLDDIEYGLSLGRTSKFPKNAIAFKWKDEIAETTLRELEWSASRTGLLNPIAIFDPVELEGTTVSRASIHNISIMEGLELGIGDRITVYKANMIIPQIAQNLTRSKNAVLPKECPVCGADTLVKNENGVRTLHCANEFCPAKKIMLFAEFVGRNAMNIEGISEETLEKFISLGFILEFADIYRLDRHRDEIISMYGFGERSYENIISSVDASRDTTAHRLLNALGISGIGLANARLICRHFNDDLSRIRTAGMDELTGIDGVGDVMANNLIDYFSNPENSAAVDELLKEVRIVRDVNAEGSAALSGLTFVITGSLENYENRDALRSEIEAKGGKVSSSVSSKTAFLINNDINSSSSKNKTAKKLGVPIITESEYIERFKQQL